MSSRIPHAICDSCWRELRPCNVPARMLDEAGKGFVVDVCCRCKAPTRGIYVLGEPFSFRCGDAHNKATDAGE